MRGPAPARPPPGAPRPLVFFKKTPTKKNRKPPIRYKKNHLKASRARGGASGTVLPRAQRSPVPYFPEHALGAARLTGPVSAGRAAGRVGTQNYGSCTMGVEPPGPAPPRLQHGPLNRGGIWQLESNATRPRKQRRSPAAPSPAGWKKQDLGAPETAGFWGMKSEGSRCLSGAHGGRGAEFRGLSGPPL